MKTRIVSGIVAVAAAMSLMTVAPASAFESGWYTGSGAGHPDCGRIEWWRSGNTATISTLGCDWYLSIRAKYNDNGKDYITAYATGRKGASITRLRMVAYSVKY